MIVDHKETFAHVFGDCRKFRLLALKLLNLAVDHTVLIVNFREQGGKFFINLALFRVLKVNRIHRAQDAL